MESTYETLSSKTRKNRTASILFLPLINAATFIGLPLYIWKYGVRTSDLVIFGFFFVTTSMAITMGYHRFFAHSTFKAGKAVEFLLLFFGAATFEGSALKWSAMHRTHHRFTDTEKDPYNIKEGFFYAHMGWFMFWKQPVDYNNAKDLQKSALVVHQHEHYMAWSYAAGILFPLLMGLACGNLAGALMWGVVARICLVFHSAFFINSFAHYFGSRPYDTSVSARDNWIGAFLTNGEGYHNYHHRFPQDYRNGIRWYHWDPTKWLVWTLSKFGVTRELRRTPDEQISAARLAVRTGAPVRAEVMAAGI